MKSFRIKLLIYFSVLVLAALMLPFWHYGATINEEVVDEAKHDALTNLEVVAWLLRDHPGFQEAEELDSWITEIGGKMGVRITFIQDGRVLADSQVAYPDVAGMDDHSSRPEVLQALNGEEGVEVRFSSTVKKDLVYAARTMDYLPGIGPGVLRLASPFSTIKHRTETLRKNMFLGLFLTLGVMLLLGMIISSNLSVSIQRLARTAQAIGRGDYGKRIRFYPGREFKPLADAINAMAAGIERHISTIEEQRGQLMAVFNGMTEGVMVLNASGRIHHFNESLERMFPDLAGKVGRKPLEAVMEPAIQKAADRILAAREAVSVTIPITASDGRFIEVNLEPFYNDDGLRQLVLVFHDITGIKQAEQMQKDFVANVSHELRTPLTSIKGYAETLMAADNLDKAMADRFLGVILKNADHMSSMVNDLLRLAKNMHAGKGKEPEPVDIADAVAGVVRDLSPSARERGVALTNGVDPAKKFVALADPQHMSEVLRNLMENAVHYGPEKGVVGVTAEEEEGMIVVSVQDQGPGIPERERRRIFERFYRGKDRKELNDKGGHSGLGLAICKQLVTGMGGKVWVENNDTGTVFRFTIPKA